MSYLVQDHAVFKGIMLVFEGQLFSSSNDSTNARDKSGKNQGMTLLVVDEIDVLITKDQSVRVLFCARS